MSNKARKDQDDMLPEYDFDYSKGVRGKYYHQLMNEGSTVILLDSDVAKAFPDSASVNETLRTLLDLNRAIQRRAKRPRNRS
jgi:hypothetical protein